MKCINCFREINEGLKFCPKCGFKQPDDRAAYEREHPELADALPEDEILEKLSLDAKEPRTAMSREEFVQLFVNDPHCDSIVKMVDEGAEKFGIKDDDTQERWLAKCAELLSDKQGFYPYFIKLLDQDYAMARDLLFNQASYGMDFADESHDEEPPELPTDIPELPPSLPTHNTRTIQEQESVKPYNTGNIPPLPTLPPANDGPDATTLCPICHNHLSPGTTECPFCHQLLDWSDTSSQSHKATYDESENNYIWILPVAFIAVLILIICFAAVKCDRASNKRDYSDEAYSVMETEQVEAAEAAATEETHDYYDYKSQEVVDDYNDYDDYDDYSDYDEPADEYDPYEDEEYDYNSENYYGY